MDLEKYISSYIIQTQEEEIKRIALELHEGVGQTLYSVFSGLQVMGKEIDKPLAKNYLNEMTQVLEKTIQEIRLLSVELHPPTLSTLGLVASVKSYLKLYTSTFGVVVHVINNGQEKILTEHKSITLFRVCQEALANIAKYADTGDATLTFNWDKDNVSIEIKDNGSGFDCDCNVQMTRSSGLAVMNERMSLVGGTCTITSVPGNGTIVRAELPLS